MARRFWYIFLVAILSLPCQTGQAKLFNGEEFYLDNGMQVIVVPNHRVPIVKHMVWYKSGSVDEKPGKGGTAHLLEHLMFRGTKKIKGNDFNRIMDENGAESNAFTSTDVTAYHQTLDISKLETAMMLEADRMENLNFSDEDFATERQIVYQERKQRVDNNPSAYFGEALRRSLWQEHPYSRPVTGTDEEILSLTPQDVWDFYHQHYVPSNAVLVLSGDIDVYTAKKLAQKYYGKIAKGESQKSPNFPVLEASSKQRIEMSRPQINALRIVESYVAPSKNFEEKYLYALQVLSEYLGGGETSKFYKKLVLRDKKALDVAVSYDGVSRSYGAFSVSAVPQNGVEAEDLISAFSGVWNEAMSELNEKELARIKQKMLAGLVYLKDNPKTAADISGMMASVGYSLADIEQHADNIQKVTVADVQKAATFLRENSPKITGVLKPQNNGGENG